MNFLRPLLAPLLALLLVGVSPASAREPATPAGHWQGAITLPGTSLAIRVDLEEAAGEWIGSIDIPAQSLSGFKLGAVTVQAAEVSFTMPGVPGDPSFTGVMAEDGMTLSGTMTQGGQGFPFELERKPKPAAGIGATPPKGIPGKGLTGHWQASLKPTPVIELRLVLEITSVPSGASEGTLISVDQNQARMPLTEISEEDGVVRLEIGSAAATFEGRLSADGSEIEGDWKQGAGTLPLVFKRLPAAPTFARPQEPVRPYPYADEEVVFENPGAGIKLAGTLTTPRAEGPHPAVVLVTGSGPQDRDESLMGHRPFLVLADHLTRAGIAVLRYDDRGVGKSEGDFGAATHDDFVTDALAAVQWLKTRKEIDPGRIGLVGHSEGGIVAPLAAVERPDDIAFLVLLAGVGVPMEELLVRQGKDIARVMGADAEALNQTSAKQRDIFRLLKDETNRATLETKLRAMMEQQVAELTEEQRRALGIHDATMEAQLQTLLTPWFRRLLAHDPQPVLRRVTCPVLAINGEKDLQVAAKENLDGIAAALKAGGNNHVKTIEFPGLNHLFQTCTTGAISEYGQIEETFNPAALRAVSEWIRETTASD